MHQLYAIYERGFALIISFVFLFVSTRAATVTYVVGPSGGATHATILAAYNACTTAANNYIIEIQTTYVTEALPITLAVKTNSGVIIRPQGALTISGSNTQIFFVTGADNITFDGRVGSTGSTVSLTIDNTSNAASNETFKFDNDATNNTIMYCNVKGSSNFGVVYFGSTTGTTGNDNNTVDHCVISKSSGGVPSYAVNTAGTAGKENDHITISNCSIIDFTTYGIYEATNSDAWTITGNSFYQPAAYTPTANMVCIYMNDGTNHTVSGNFFGGTSASCGGTAYTLNSSGFYFACIYFQNTITAGTCNVQGNTIKNFNVSTNGASYSFLGIYCDGAANYVVGATGAGNGNAIGDTVSGTASIVATSAGAHTNLFRGIKIASSGTNSVQYNAFGAITCNGTATGSTLSRVIEVTSAAGATDVKYNKIGNVTASNIIFSVAANAYHFDAIYFNSNSNASISNNTIQNISSPGATSPTSTGITISGSGVYTVNYNSVLSSALSCPFYAIDITSTNVGGTCTVNGNKIKTLTIATNAAASYSFKGIGAAGSAIYNIGASGAGNGNAIGDTVSGTGNITITATGAQSHIFRGIRLSTTGANNTIKYNAMGSITCNGSATGTPLSRFIEVPLLTGATTIQYNTIGNPGTLANISFPVTTNTYGFLGICYDANSNGDISYNTVQNVSNLGTGNVGDEEAITITGSGTYTVTGNTIGNTTADNMVYAANMLMHGIWFKGTTGTLTSTGNIVQNFKLTNAGTSAIYHGQCIDVGGDVTFSQDTVRNITFAGAGTVAAPPNSDPNLQGIRLVSNGGVGQVINQCAVKNMSLTSSVASITLAGIYTANACSGSITRNHVSGNTIAATDAGSYNIGMYLKASGAWDINNNVVLLDNGGPSPAVEGIDITTTVGSGTVAENIYHNSVKIYGTATSGSGSTTCFRELSGGGGGTVNTTIKNNVWQNIRTNSGATSKHYTCMQSNMTGTQVYDYNYLETSAAPIAYWNAVDQAAIANWRTASAGDANAQTGTASIENVWGYSSTAPIPGNGLAYAPVPQDKKFCNRATGVAPAGPWIGAWECSPVVILPIEMLNFNGKCEKGTPVLEWTTATEINNNYFSIERSTNGKDFLSIGKVKGAGNSSVISNYEFVDNEASSGEVLFYRIRQVDYDGQFEYFGPVFVKCSSSGLEILPTVSEGMFYLVGDIGKAEIAVYSAIGEAVYYQNGSGSRYLIDISDKANGVYFVKIKTEQRVEVKKIVVRH